MKTIFTLEAQDKNLGATLIELREKLRRLNAELRAAEDGTETYHDLARQVSGTKDEVTKLTERQKELNRDFKAMQVPADSLAGLRLEYSRLVQSISNLSKAERESKFGRSIIAQAAATKKSIDEVEQSVGRFTGNVGNYKSAFDNFLPAISKAGVLFGGLFAALQGGSQIIETTRQFDKLQATLKQAVGSETAAKALFEEIKTFAAETPVALEEVVGAFVKLENRNFDPTVEQMRTMADIAVSQGKSLDQFVEAVLDAQTGQFERLKEFGIVANKHGDNVKLTFRGQSEVIKNTSENLSEYLLGLGKLPGISGAAVAISKTLDGSLSNLSDNLSQLFAAIGSGGGFLQRFVGGMNEALGAINEYVSVPLSQTLITQQAEFNSLVGALQDYNKEADKGGDYERVRAGLIGELNGKYGEYLGNLDLNKASEEQLRTLMDSANQEFERRIFLQIANENSAALFKVVTQEAQKLTAALKEQNAVIGERRNETGAPVFRATEAGLTTGIEGVTAGVDVQKAKLKEARTEFDEYQKTVDETAKVLFGSLESFNEYRKKQEDAGKAAKGGAEAIGVASDSIAALQKRVSELTKRLNEAPQSQVPKILGDLIKAEQELDAVQQRLENLRASDRASSSLADMRATVSKLTQDLENAPTDRIPAILGDLIKAEDQLKALEDRIKELRQGLDGAPGVLEVEAQIKGLDDQALKARIESLFAGIDAPAIDIPLEIETSEADMLAVIGFNDTRLASEQLTTEQINALRQSLTDANLERLRTEAEADEKNKEKRAELLEQGVEQGLAIASKLASGLAEIENARIDKQRTAALALAEDEYNKRIEKAQGNTKKEAAIRADFEKKKEQIERDSAKKRQKVAITEAIIQGSLAVIKALPNFILAAATAAFTAIQVATMSAQEFAKGGPLKAKRFKAVGGTPQTAFDIIPGMSATVSGSARMAKQSPSVSALENVFPMQAVSRPLQNLAQDLAGGGVRLTDLPDMQDGGFTPAPAGSLPDKTGRRPSGVIAKPWGVAVLHEDEYVGPASQVRRYPALFAALEADRVAHARPYAVGGFTMNAPQAPATIVSAPTNVNAVASFSLEEVQQIANAVAEATAKAVSEQVRTGLAEGLNDADRRLERQNAFQIQRSL